MCTCPENTPPLYSDLVIQYSFLLLLYFVFLFFYCPVKKKKKKSCKAGQISALCCFVATANPIKILFYIIRHPCSLVSVIRLHELTTQEPKQNHVRDPYYSFLNSY